MSLKPKSASKTTSPKPKSAASKTTSPKTKSQPKKLGCKAVNKNVKQEMGKRGPLKMSRACVYSRGYHNKKNQGGTKKQARLFLV